MNVQQQARAYLAKYHNVIPGPPPILRQLSEDELLTDLRATEAIGAAFSPESTEAQVVGNVIRGWIGQELRNRRFASDLPYPAR